MSTSKGNGAAFNADAEAGMNGGADQNAPAEQRHPGGRTPAEQDYLTARADEAEAAVAAVNDQISALKASLKQRQADAVQARRAADGKVS